MRFLNRADERTHPVFHSNFSDAARNRALESIVPLLRRNLGRTMDIKGSSIRKSVVGRLLLIDVAGSVAVLALWYFVFSTYNRKKGATALRWVQTACAGKARILDSRWKGTSRLQARLHFPSGWFENARVIVKFRPRALP